MNNKLWKAVVTTENNNGNIKTESGLFENYKDAEFFVNHNDHDHIYIERKLFEYEISSVKELHQKSREVETVVKHIETYWE